MSARWSLLTVGAMLAMLAGSMPAAVGTENPEQAQVNSLKPVERALFDLDARGVLEGTGCAPHPGDCEGDLPRWEAFVWVSRIADIDSKPHTAFRDVPAHLWWAPLAQGLFDNLVVWGCGVNPLTACPYRSTTRAEMASMIVRSHNWSPGTVGFTDLAVGSVHFRDIESLGHAGLTRGCHQDPLRFCPDRAITRIEAAVMLASLLDRDLPEPVDSDAPGHSGTEGGNGNRNAGSGNAGNGNGGNGNGGSGNAGNGSGGSGSGGSGSGGNGNPGGGETSTSPSDWTRTSGWGVACPAHRHDHPGESKGHAILPGPFLTEDGRWVERTGLWGHRHENGTTRWWWWAPVDDAHPRGGLHPHCDHEAEDHDNVPGDG